MFSCFMFYVIFLCVISDLFIYLSNEDSYFLAFVHHHVLLQLLQAILER